MSFVAAYKRTIQDGDVVIAYVSPETMVAVLVGSGKVHRNSLGAFSHADVIGRPFGCHWPDTQRQRGIHALHPTPGLWTAVLAHRTQIIYTPDAAFICAALQLHPGSIVLESGTGSGSLSHHLLCAICPGGRLLTLEYHEQRARLARDEFAAHGLHDDQVTVLQRDVCRDGFGVHDTADAVFLDLPNPWSAIEAARTALRKDQVGRMCAFSPCIEQVQRTYVELHRHGFQDTHTVTVVTRTHSARTARLDALLRLPDGNVGEEKRDVLVSRAEDDAKGHTSYLTFAILCPSSTERVATPSRPP